MWLNCKVMKKFTTPPPPISTSTISFSGLSPLSRKKFRTPSSDSILEGPSPPPPFNNGEEGSNYSICRPGWNDQFLKISALNSLRFQSYWDLKTWPKWVFQGKIHHFEFTFSVITIVLVILSFWNLVLVKFLKWEIQKLHLEDLKINHS